MHELLASDSCLSRSSCTARKWSMELCTGSAQIKGGLV